MDAIYQDRGKAAGTYKHQDEVKQQSPVSSPPSSSSPSQEFSFSTSLNPSTCTIPDKTKAASPLAFAVDVTPADDIFFHGHLLPLDLVSRFPVYPRSSNNSAGSLSLPTRESLDIKQHLDRYCSSGGSNNLINKCKNNHSHGPTRGKNRSKSFPQLLGLKRWHKGSGNNEDEQKNKRSFVFEVSQVIKKYAGFVKPLFSIKGKQANVQFDRHNYNSFSSGSSIKRDKQELRGRRGGYSAPSSVETSPAHSGILVATGTSSSTSESTMEELQAAIQAAIAYCKNSVSVEG